MSDSTVKAILSSADKRHNLGVNAVVCIATAAITGFVTVYTSPKPVSPEEMKSMMKDIVSTEVARLTYRIDSVKKNADDAKKIGNDIQRQVLVSLAAMSDRMAAVAESVARIDERTKKVGT